MKTKLISTITVVALICAAFTTGVVKPLEVFAATKTATLVDTKVSFDGNEPVVIQSYKIDGYNYVRVAEIARQVNMGVIPSSYEIGVVIQPNTPYTGGELEKLTESNISVELTAGTVFYSGMRYENVECFKYADRYYYKLADIFAASQYALEQNIVFTERAANGNHWKEASPKTFTTFNIEWDSTTSTVNVNRNVTDLQKMFDDIRGNTSSKTEQASLTAPAVTTQTVQANPPVIGAVLANILIDKNKSAYNADGSLNTDNVTDIYAKTTGSFGQCTWYAVSRLREVTGVNISSAPNRLNGKGLENWVDEAMSGNYPNITGTADKSAIKAGSIAVWKNHIVFVEYVERDNSGSPINVYYTEANQNHTGNPYKEGVYYPDYDCKVKVKTYSDFTNHKSNGNPLIGYVAAK